MKQRLSSVGVAVLTEDVFVVMNQMVRVCTLSRYCSLGLFMAEMWGNLNSVTLLCLCSCLLKHISCLLVKFCGFLPHCAQN